MCLLNGVSGSSTHKKYVNLCDMKGTKSRIWQTCEGQESDVLVQETDNCITSQPASCWNITSQPADNWMFEHYQPAVGAIHPHVKPWSWIQLDLWCQVLH